MAGAQRDGFTAWSQVRNRERAPAGQVARMRRIITPTIAALLAAALTAGIAVAGHSHRGGDEHFRHSQPSYAIGLWGDLPYSTTQATVGVPNLIADMNRQDLAFTAHDGDLKSGSTECTDSVYTQAVSYFNSLRAPAAFTPGDNDWVDCDRTAGYNDRVQLDKERKLFFSTPFTLGQRRLHQEVQQSPLCLGAGGPAACVENRRWTLGGVTYATLNVQGTCNNLCDSKAGGGDADPAEYAARNAADIAWMQGTFQEATARHSAAVMFISQADPGFNDDQVQGAPTRSPTTLVEDDAQASTDGFHDFLVALRDQVAAFKKPVVYVHGDSHYFRIDKPFENAAGQRLENFTRLETFGDHQENGNNDVNWVKVLVDPRSREVFSFQQEIVPGNRTAVPAP